MICFSHGEMCEIQLESCPEREFYERQASDSEERLDKIYRIHAKYFDISVAPGSEYSNPEPEDVWRYDRDFRAAMVGNS